ncbi:mannose-1-phosphate guanylyltransferase [Chitinophaga silvatica]|uniref:mannose-1-phosphate guanylyltransferase n=1 Tax=Chitinophaga silvatica TaxID=2282649 RepID=A0A3E1YBG6_9BACT|nr:mannose-1-phosphate guanylyltransferase [Chitinophaga silvatica]RFS23386.1 mannose-1-phosphate guanylyltransferase [Chitinophaga silvatica]
MTQLNSHFYVAIMAGGIGSRFWPQSRTDNPKQFLDILNTGKTLLQWTYERFCQFIPKENIFVVTHYQYTNKVHEQLPELPVANIVNEPSRKNTAPCVAYISHKIYKQDPQANIICAPADHLIVDGPAFTNACLNALLFVQKHSALLTLGIKPTRPDTGYGYIQFEPQHVADNVYQVKTFTEKPNLELAKTFLQSGDFLWNAGIFVWNVNTILAALKQYLPEMNELFEQISDNLNTPQEKESIEKVYPQCTNISIDYGIMEKASNVYVIPSNFGWSDLGTWASAYENLEKDYLGNAVQGKNVMIIDATKCMVKVPNEKLVLLQGLDEFIVIDTPDVLMICKKENEQQIKEYVAEIKRNKGEKFL